MPQIGSIAMQPSLLPQSYENCSQSGRRLANCLAIASGTLLQSDRSRI
jgi:hypothetical protein